MIRLFKVKEKERDASENANRVFSSFSDLTIGENHNTVFSSFSNLDLHENPIQMPSLAENTGKIQTMGELRLYKDISELSLPKITALVFPNGKQDMMHFEVSIWPDEGCYSGGLFQFSIELSPNYPYEAPTVHCKTRVYHPSIDYTGNVRLHILDKEWKPVHSVNTVIHGLHRLFLYPDPEDPLNHDAATLLRDDPEMFAMNVKKSMAGERLAGSRGWTYFYPCTGLDVHSVLLSVLENPRAVTFL
ncbi:CAAX prenyl protease [Ranunculus cassubicifolius]